jgi:acyl-CoA reductase-like NAD-dependent aldehyde dehydrogenase
MERVAEIVAERRDDLARTLTLDQGKPLHSEARRISRSDSAREASTAEVLRGRRLREESPAAA